MSNKFTISKQSLPLAQNQAKLILESNALGLIQPLFFTPDANKLAIEQAQSPDAKNWMGLPVFDTVEFDELHYTTNEGKARAIDKMVLTNCMHVVNMTKNIVKTPIAGADGTVKEYIGLGDYQITLSGLLVSKYANVPPELEIKQLYEFCKAPAPIQCYSNFLAHFEVFTIVVDGEPNFTQIEGTRNAVQFTINCISDKPFEIEYNQNNKGRTSPVSVPSFI